MIPLLNRLPQTRIKLAVARVLYRVAYLVYRKNEQIVTRNGIVYQLDLREGVDLSLFLFGAFQKHVSHNRLCRPAENATVLDVGANVGTMTLQFARQVPRGKVFAFEPSHYAFAKLKKNLALNPQLAPRVVPVQTFVSSVTTTQPDMTAYASWNLAQSGPGDRHPIHGGSVKSTEGVGAVTLDDFAGCHPMGNIELIKIDTDGYEIDVLRGAREVISRFQPAIILEMGVYILQERGVGFESFCDFFAERGYVMLDSKAGKRITAGNYARYVPLKGTVDVVALPARRLAALES